MDQEFMNAVKELLTALDQGRFAIDMARSERTKVEELLSRAEKSMGPPRFRPEGPFHMYDTWFQRYWVLESHREVMKREGK